LAKNRAAGTVEVPVPPGGIVHADLALSADGAKLAAVITPSPGRRGDDGAELGVWDVADGKRAATRVLEVGTTCITFLPGDHEVLISHAGGSTVWVPDRDALREFPAGGTPPFFSQGFSPDGRTFVAAVFQLSKEGNRSWTTWSAVFETATLKERERLPRPHGANADPPQGFATSGRTAAMTREGVLLFDLTNTARDPTWAKDPIDPARLWAALAGSPADVGVAIRALANRPALALDLFREKLAPAGEAASGEAATAKLIAALDAPAFADREAAGKALLASLRRVEPALRAALATATSPEQKQRLSALLAAADKYTPDELRHIRAMEVLERIGTPAAADLAAKLAGGAANAILTREAKATLARLKR
jgi:hypothetical protein